MRSAGIIRTAVAGRVSELDFAVAAATATEVT
jgi:hypothetical protein